MVLLQHADANMLQLADDEERRFPKAAQAIRKRRFADDFYEGTDSISEALDHRYQLIPILAAAKMEVGKWSSNVSELLPTEVVESKDEIFKDEVVSALGIKWNSKIDTFCFRVSQFIADDTKLITKRRITSDEAKLFDPIGWFSPVVIRAKILIQDLWHQDLNRDQAVPAQSVSTWIKFRDQLKEIETILIPRWLGSFESSRFELHCFCDASEKAYVAALYAVIYTVNKITSKLITCKSKVAPIKTVSIPRLELCGAVVLSRLTTYVLQKFERVPSRVHCWSDSKVV